MNKTLSKLKEIKIKRSKEVYRPTHREKDLINWLEVNQKLSTTPAHKSLNAIILKFAFCTGLRISEVVTLKLDNVYLDEDKLFVLNGKGGRNRWIGINKNLKPDLVNYIFNQRPKSNFTNLFLLPNGRPISRDRLEKRIKVIAQKLNAPGGLHAWRRGCLTHYAAKGAPMPFLQMIAGHSSILTTQSYVNPNLEEVLERQKQW